MRPLPRLTMWARAVWDMTNAPDRFTAKTVYQSSSVIRGTVRSMVMPALLTRMSNLPWWSMTSATERRAVLGRADVAVVQGGPRAQLVFVFVSERVGALGVSPVARRHRRALAAQAAADRSTDTAGSAGHERHSALQRVPTGVHGGVVLVSVQGAHGGQLLLVDNAPRPPNTSSENIPAPPRRPRAIRLHRLRSRL